MKISIGQYVPGQSLIHRADPRTKLILTLAYMIAVMLAGNFFSYLLCAVYLAAAFICAHINITRILKSLKPVLIMMAITVLLNIFFHGGSTLWLSVGIIKIYKEGVLFAVKILVRIVLMVLGSTVLTYTTTSIRLTDGLENLLSPLKKFHFPAHEIAMIMSIALRFIPTFVDETDRIIKAQTARGTDFDTKNLIQKIKCYIPILIPLFLSAWRKADDLANAMIARCYRGGEGRVKYHLLKYTYIDSILAIITIVLFTGIVLLNKFV